MPQQIWLREDLKNILLSLNVASAATARFSDEAATTAYRQGFEEAIETFAVALGIAPSEVGLRGNSQLRVNTGDSERLGLSRMR